MDAKSSRTAQSKASSTHFAGEGDERLQCALLPRGHWPAHRWFDVDVVPQFENPFHMEDMMVFDDATLQSILCGNGFGLTVEKLAYSLRGMPKELVRRIIDNMQTEKRASFLAEFQHTISEDQVEAARHEVLDRLFWELTYWKTPDLYEELTEGEQLHPQIFQQLEPDVRGNIVLDAGAGSGRASLECVRYGAKKVYAVEPSPGLLHILQKKLDSNRVVLCQGRFDALPLYTHSVDLAISCSAFTAEETQGGEPGLAELRRVTKPGGKVVVIWPRLQDYDWLEQHGFTYVRLPAQEEMCAHFRSMQSALRCARHFYAHNPKVAQYIERERTPDVPFSVLGINPPCDYCWLLVD